jgi:hypothetical protein
MIPRLEMGIKSGNVVIFSNNYVIDKPEHEVKFILLNIL